MNIYGEVSRSNNGGLAQVHGAIITVDPRFFISILYRNYGLAYQNLNGNGVGETKTAAEMQALTFAKLALASQVESNVNALISANLANQQLNNEDAASITQTISNSKELISAQLGYVEPAFKIYRIPANPKNTEVQMRIFYDVEQSLQIAKKVIQKELKDKLKVNEEQLNKMMGINFEDLENLSIRQQRDIIKKRATEMNKIKSMKFKY
jgi:uncharacterized protein YneF (UPF0154 family)